MRRRNHHPILDVHIAGLYLKGYSTYAIAEEFDISQGKVARTLRRTKTPRRSNSEAQQAWHDAQPGNRQRKRLAAPDMRGVA